MVVCQIVEPVGLGVPFLPQFPQRGRLDFGGPGGGIPGFSGALRGLRGGCGGVIGGLEKCGAQLLRPLFRCRWNFYGPVQLGGKLLNHLDLTIKLRFQGCGIHIRG